MISRIIEVEVVVISRSRRLKLITLTETSIILDITKPNLIIVLLYIERKRMDEIFVISRIIEVEVVVISRSRRLRLITLTETSIILDITKPNLIIVLLYIERKKLKSCFCFFTDGKQHKARELTLRNHAPRPYMT